MTATDYGQLWALWLYDSNATTGKIAAQTPDEMIFTGEHVGAGSAVRFSYASGQITTKQTGGVPASFSVATINSGSKAIIKGPTGGQGQFKGLTQSTTQDKYVKVICTGVQPLYYTLYP